MEYLPTGIFGTHASVATEARKVWEDAYKKRRNAPVKRGYNSTFRTQISSKNDILRAAQEDLRFLNDYCDQMGWPSVWVDPDEKVVKMGSLVKEE